MTSHPSRRALPGISAALLIASLLIVPSAEAAKRPPAARGSATLTVRISGLPKGIAPVATLRGPGTKRNVRKATSTVRGLRPGTYVLRLKAATAKRGRRGLPKGSRAYPATTTARVKVAKGAKATVTGSYRSVIAPNVKAIPSKVLDVAGDPTNPSAISVPRTKGASYRVGGYLTSGPTKQLPAGVISKITSVAARKRSYGLQLTAVPVTEVVPRFSGGLAVRPIEGGAAETRTAPKPSGASFDLRYSTNPIARKFAAAMKRNGCRADTDPTGSYVEPTASGPTFGPWEWDSFSGAVRTSMGFSLGFDYKLSAKTTLNCNFEKVGFTEVFAVPIGPLVVPMFVSAKFPFNVRIGSVQSTVQGHVGRDFKADFDSGRPDWVKVDSVPSSSDAVSGGGLAATLATGVGFFLEAGIGVPHLLNVRVKTGPSVEFKASGADWSHVVCELNGKLSASLIGQFLVKTVTKELYTQPIFGMQLPFCTVTEPIVGTWERGGSDTLAKFKVEQGASSTEFKATALTPTVFGTCTAGNVGDTSTITGGMGTYTWSSRLWDPDDCVVIDSDPAAKVTISPISRDRLQVCKKYPNHPLDSTCSTYSRSAD